MFNWGLLIFPQVDYWFGETQNIHFQKKIWTPAISLVTLKKQLFLNHNFLICKFFLRIYNIPILILQHIFHIQRKSCMSINNILFVFSSLNFRTYVSSLLCNRTFIVKMVQYSRIILDYIRSKILVWVCCVISFHAFDHCIWWQKSN